ncbi:MAG: transporter substrate-binding domain-containing protein [Oscillospiraceae bacterium]
MKKFIALLLALMLVFSLAACGKKDEAGTAEKDKPTEAPANALEKIKSSGKLIVATSPDYAPVEFLDPDKSGQEQFVGSDIELAKYIAKELGVEVVFEAIAFETIPAAVSQGTADIGISGFSWRKDRADTMDLSDMYFAQEAGQKLLVLKGNEKAFSKAEDFSGKSVACQNGSLQQTLVEEQLPSDVKIELVTNIGDAIMMLTTKKIDAVALSGENAQSYCNNYPDLSIADFIFKIEDEGYLAMMKKGETELVAEINKIISKVVAENMYQKWFDDANAYANKIGAAQ